MPAYNKTQQTRKTQQKKTQKSKGRISEEIYDEILARDKKCVTCGRPSTLECHHITPRSRGGRGDDPSNLAMMCKDCHYNKLHAKGDYTTIKKLYLYMIRIGYKKYEDTLEAFEEKRRQLNGNSG